jgi:hypothetical protein
MQNVAFILIGIGILVLIGWRVKGFFMASEINILVRIAIGAIGIGTLVLIGVAIRDRLKTLKQIDSGGY